MLNIKLVNHSCLLYTIHFLPHTIRTVNIIHIFIELQKNGLYKRRIFNRFFLALLFASFYCNSVYATDEQQRYHLFSLKTKDANSILTTIENAIIPITIQEDTLTTENNAPVHYTTSTEKIVILGSYSPDSRLDRADEKPVSSSVQKHQMDESVFVFRAHFQAKLEESGHYTLFVTFKKTKEGKEQHYSISLSHLGSYETDKTLIYADNRFRTYTSLDDAIDQSKTKTGNIELIKDNDSTIVLYRMHKKEEAKNNNLMIRLWTNVAPAFKFFNTPYTGACIALFGPLFGSIGIWHSVLTNTLTLKSFFKYCTFNTLSTIIGCNMYKNEALSL